MHLLGLPVHRPGFLLGWGLLLGLAAARCGAALPAAAIADPRYALGCLIVTHYPGVRPDGGGDSRAGIQQALDDAYANDLVLLFPPGEYVIGDSLRCFQWWNWNARGDFQGGGRIPRRHTHCSARRPDRRGR